MKRVYKYLTLAACVGIFGGLSSCNNFLDIEPESFVTPENYFTEESQLQAYLIPMYEWLPDHGTSNTMGLWDDDSGTDIAVGSSPADMYVEGVWQVTTEGETVWSFENIYSVNYFFENVLPKYEAGAISGSEDLIKQHIGEAYFFRAYAYFEKLQAVGDFPIIDGVLENNFEILEEAAKRSPRNEVARFILEDLDKAIEYMSSTSADGGTRNLLSKPVAQLFKSRVALYEASWLRNFAGTAFVPGGTDWPGADMDYNQGITLYAESGSLEAEVEFFLKEAIEAADDVASIAVLSENTGITCESTSDVNPYFSMFGDVDLSPYSEILYWKAYNAGLGLSNGVIKNLYGPNSSVGMTRGLAISALDVNGLPHYASGSLFTEENGEGDIFKVRLGDNGIEGQPDRDNRFALFLKVPNQVNAAYNADNCNNAIERAAPEVFWAATTGYMIRKGTNLDGSMGEGNTTSYTGCPVFRSAEAMLNYMEAYYMLYGSTGGNVMTYWEALRARAGFNSGSIQATIDAIDMEKEAENDWGAYSAGQLLTDKTLFAIRKERKIEMMYEGHRLRDLKRWRSMDQLISEPYHIQGMKFWNCENLSLYDNLDPQAGVTYFSYLTYDGSSTSDISGPEHGDCLFPYREIIGQHGYDGLIWKMAHYLSPIELEHIMLTSDNADYSTSPIYQNPYWPLQAGGSAEK